VALETAMTFEDLLRRLNPYFLDVRTKKLSFKPSMRLVEDEKADDPVSALFVVDDVPQGQTYRNLMGLNPSDIHSVTALRGVQGTYIYGSEANGGVVFIETKLYHFGDKYDLATIENSIPGDTRNKELLLFRRDAEFYNPPEKIMESDPQYWIRPTLYWNNECFYDGKRPVKIKYFNHQKKGSVYIIVNGVTYEGLPISGVSKYMIR
jgi:hypothetical protein